MGTHAFLCTHQHIRLSAFTTGWPYLVVLLSTILRHKRNGFKIETVHDNYRISWWKRIICWMEITRNGIRRTYHLEHIIWKYHGIICYVVEQSQLSLLSCAMPFFFIVFLYRAFQHLGIFMYVCFQKDSVTSQSSSLLIVLED